MDIIGTGISKAKVRSLGKDFPAFVQVRGPVAEMIEKCLDQLNPDVHVRWGYETGHFQKVGWMTLDDINDYKRHKFSKLPYLTDVMVMDMRCGSMKYN